MRRKLVKERVGRDALNLNIMNSNRVRVKPPISGGNQNEDKSCMKLRDKVSSLVQMQLRHHQSNQNYLLQDPTTHYPDSFENEKISIYINTKYDIVEKVAKQLLFKIVKEDEDWNISWIDGAINSSKAFNLRRNQRVNHFPGMNEISRKDKLQKNLKIMQRYFPIDYNIFPKTWSLPAEKMEILNYTREQNHDETFIIKPACSSQGRGIILIKDIKSLSVIGNTICQSYINNPFLIDGYKFDLRIYVLITSCDPFRVYIYEEGLARFATCPYEKPNRENLNNVYMHLTNYSVQRNSEKFNTDEISGTKRRLTTIYDWFENHGYNAEKIWKNIDDVIIKTMLSANNSILHHYSATFPDQYRTSACFELLGFDVILDDTLKPYVLEVNHSPSLETETGLDINVKTQLLIDIFNLVTSVPMKMQKITDLERIRSAERLYWSRHRYISSRKASFEFRKMLQEIQVDLERSEMDNKNGFRILYPVLNQTEKYQRFFDFNCENHRTSFIKCALFDDSEHKRFLDVQKEIFPTVVMKPKENYKSYKLKVSNEHQQKQLRTTNNAQPIIRDSHVVRQFNSNVASLKQKELFGYTRNSNVLLNNSTKSLQKILSYKKFTELTKIINDKKMSMDSDNVVKKVSVSCSRSHSARNYRPNSTDIAIVKSPTQIKKQKKTKELILYKVDETSLNQQTSVGVEWESSLSSDKIQYAPQFNFESQNKNSVTSKDDFKMFQKSPVSTVYTRRHSFSMSNDKNSSLLSAFNSKNTWNQDLDHKTKSNKSLKPNNFDDSLTHRCREKEEVFDEIVNPSIFFSDIKQSSQIHFNLSLDGESKEKQMENIFTTLPINSVNVNNFRKFENNVTEFQDCVNNIIEATDFSNGFSDKLSTDSFSVSEIQSLSTLFAAEIGEVSDLTKKTKYDTIKYFYSPRLEKHSLTPKILQKSIHFAICFDFSKLINHCETRLLPKLDRHNYQKKHCRAKHSFSKVFERNQTACKRKHLNSSITCNLELTDLYPNPSEVMEYVKSDKCDYINEDVFKFFQNNNLEDNQNVNNFLVDKTKYVEKNEDKNNKFVTFENEISINQMEYTDDSFKSSFRNKEYQCQSKELTRETAATNPTKKRKPIINSAKVSHERVEQYVQEKRVPQEQFLDDTEIDWKDNMDRTTNEDYNLQNSNLNVNNNVCEINITPSTVTDDCIAFSENYNFTICVDSNQNSSVVCPKSLLKMANKNGDDTISQFDNSDSVYRVAMIQNKNTNHYYPNEIENKAPVVVKYTKQSLKKFDVWESLCMGNLSEGSISPAENSTNPQIKELNIVKLQPLSSQSYLRNSRFKLPEITLRGFNNIIQLLPHRKHKNKSYNLTSLNENQNAPKLSQLSIDASLNYLAKDISKKEPDNINKLQFFKKSEPIEISRSLLCQYLKNVGSKNKNKKPPKLSSSTKRLCKILTDKTNNKNIGKSKFESCQAINESLILQYVNY